MLTGPTYDAIETTYGASQILADVREGLLG